MTFAKGVGNVQELTVACLLGLVSLSILGPADAILGPPYMHQRRPEYSHFLGDVSPESDPLKVIRAVSSLHAIWQQENLHSDIDQESGPALPLIVNTNGWIQVNEQTTLLCLQV